MKRTFRLMGAVTGGVIGGCFSSISGCRGGIGDVNENLTSWLAISYEELRVRLETRSEVEDLGS